jgi:hypothetical protein
MPKAAQPEELETYEPPQFIVVGSLPALTGGAAGADTDVGTSSID